MKNKRNVFVENSLLTHKHHLYKYSSQYSYHSIVFQTNQNVKEEP